MKKKLVFVYRQMIMGGAEKVLLRLIEHLDPDKYEIHVLLLRGGGRAC